MPDNFLLFERGLQIHTATARSTHWHTATARSTAPLPSVIVMTGIWYRVRERRCVNAISFACMRPRITICWIRKRRTGIAKPHRICCCICCSEDGVTSRTCNTKTTSIVDASRRLTLQCANIPAQNATIIIREWSTRSTFTSSNYSGSSIQFPFFHLTKTKKKLKRKTVWHRQREIFHLVLTFRLAILVVIS